MWDARNVKTKLSLSTKFCHGLTTETVITIVERNGQKEFIAINKLSLSKVLNQSRNIVSLIC